MLQQQEKKEEVKYQLNTLKLKKSALFKRRNLIY